MSPFSPEQTSPEIEAFMQREARRRLHEAAAPALDALSRGMAFADGPGPDEDEDDEGPTLIDDPTFDETLETIARIKRDISSQN